MAKVDEKQTLNSGTVRDVEWLRRNLNEASLAGLAERLKIELPEEAKEKRSEIATQMVKAIGEMPESEQDAVCGLLERIHTVGGTKKHNQVICDFVKEKVIPVPDDFAGYTCPAKAVYCFLMLSADLWTELEGRIAVEGFKHWRGFSLEFKEDPEEGLIEKNRKKIEREVSRWVFENEHRGKMSENIPYRVGDKEYLVIYLTDYAGGGQFWDIEKKQFTNLDNAKLVPSFHIIVTFNRETSRMNILYPSAKTSASACRAICNRVCDAAFGKGACETKAVRYDLMPLLSKDILPQSDKSLGIVGVKLVFLELALDENSRHVRAFGEKDGDLHAVAKEELKRYKDGEESLGVWVRRGQLKFDYTDADGKLKHRTVELSPTSSNIASASAEAQRKINAYLARKDVRILSDENT